MLFRNKNTGEIKDHQAWQDCLNCSFFADNPPKELERYKAPPVQLTVEQRRERRRAYLKEVREQRIGALIGNAQVRDKDRDRLARAISRNKLPFEWIMADNSRQMMTLENAQRILDEFYEREFRIFQTYLNLLDQLETTDNPESIVWPEEESN